MENMMFTRRTLLKGIGATSVMATVPSIVNATILNKDFVYNQELDLYLEYNIKVQMNWYKTSTTLHNIKNFFNTLFYMLDHTQRNSLLYESKVTSVKGLGLGFRLDSRYEKHPECSWPNGKCLVATRNWFFWDDVPFDLDKLWQTWQNNTLYPKDTHNKPPQLWYPNNRKPIINFDVHIHPV